MELTTYTAYVPGLCDMCSGDILEGDDIAFLGYDVLCTECIIDHRELEAP